MADGSCFTIGDQFIRIEGNFKVQVVVNHDLESFAFRAFSFIFINWFAIDAAFRAETIAIDTAASRQFFEELWDKFIMIFFRNVAQGIFQCQFSLGRAEAEAAVRALRMPSWKGFFGGSPLGNSSLIVIAFAISAFFMS